MENSIEKFKQILDDTNINNIELAHYFKFVGKWAIKLSILEEELNDDYFINKSLDELRKLNRELYSDILPENYSISYANPQYAVKLFGEGIGQVLSALYARLRNHIKYAFRHNKEIIKANNNLCFKIYEYISTKDYSVEGLKEIYRNEILKSSDIFIPQDRIAFLLKNNDIYSDKILNWDLSDEKYLYSFGDYITENEIKIAKFLSTYDENNLQTLASSIVKAYLNGFKRNNKINTARKNIDIVSSIGQERLLKFIIVELRKEGLQCGICNSSGTNANKQYEYDHRFDRALFFDEKYVLRTKEIVNKLGAQYKEVLNSHVGMLFIDSFGSLPFKAISKIESLKFSEEQNKLNRECNNYINGVLEKNMPGNETSFCALALPSPEIGDNFERIFEDTCRINMLDSSKYENIQQKIIDVLDRGKYVHVKGSGKNETDMIVKLREIKNPDVETNFLNSGADVNIPVGEVFTSPVLMGTNGVLQLEEIYLGLVYKNLRLTFKDGYISQYSCTNFETEEENKKYIEENLLFPHKNLPLGEFAIGTNTLAYAIFKKYNIIDKLPELIIEKMGPHFAIGDTCFCYNEDIPVYNPLDSKEVTARDNEKTILRKKDISQAYTHKHIDITLPYDKIDFINVITKSGEEIEVLKDGRFTLQGTLELNNAFDELI